MCWNRSIPLRLIEDLLTRLPISCTVGDIHIWDRESAALLHYIPAQVTGGDLACLAWNPAVDPFMFVTGDHYGTVRVWTTASPSSQLPLHIPEIISASPSPGRASASLPWSPSSPVGEGGFREVRTEGV